MDDSIPETTSVWFYTTILFALACIVTLFMYNKNFAYCPPQRIIQQNSPVTNKVIPTIDLQFSDTNFPSVVYDDIFKGNNVWLGGYNGGMNTGRNAKT